MGEAIESAAGQISPALRKIRAGGGSLQGNFYYAGNSGGTEAGLVVTLVSRDKKGQKALTAGKGIRKEIRGAKFARGVVIFERGKVVFILHSGNASKKQLKDGFKNTLSEMKGLQILKTVLVRDKAQAAPAPDDVIDKEAKLVADKTRTEEEQQAFDAEVQELIAEQEVLGELNKRLSSFLSKADAEDEHAEQLVDQLDRIEVLKNDPQGNAEALRQAQQELVLLTAVGPEPFPEVGQPVSREIGHILEMSLTLMAERSETSEKSGDAKAYDHLRAEVESQFDILSALYGSSHGNCRRLRAGLLQAQQAVMTGQSGPDYAQGIRILKDFISIGSQIVAEGRRAYTAQRAAEETLEQQRLMAIKQKLRAESELRVLIADITKFETSLHSVDEQHTIASVVTPLVAAKLAHGRALVLLDTAIFTTLGGRLVQQTGRSVLQAAATTQAEIDAAIVLCREQHAASKDALSAVLKVAQSSDVTGVLYAKYESVLQAVNAEQRLPPRITAELLDSLEQIVRVRLLQATTEEDTVRRDAMLQAAELSLRSVEQKLAADIQTHVTDYTAAAAKAETVGARLEALMDVALPQDVTPLFHRLQAIRAQLEAHQFTDALSAADTLLAEISQQITALTPAKTAWDEFSPATLQQQIDDQHAVALEYPSDPTALKLKLLSITTAVAQRSMSYSDAMDALEALTEEVRANNAAHLGISALREALPEAQGVVEAALTGLRGGLQGLAAPVIAGVESPFQKSFVDLKAEGASALTALDQARAMRTIEGLKTLAAAIVEASSGAPLQQRVAKADAVAARAEVDAQRTSTHDLLDQLQKLGKDSLGGLRRLNDGLLDAAAAEESAAAIRAKLKAHQDKELAVLQETLDQATASASQLRIDLTNEVRRAVKSLEDFSGEVNAHQSGFWGAMRAMTGLNGKEEYTRYVEVLRSELGVLQTVAASAYPGLMAQTVKDLQVFQADVEDARKGLKDIKVTDAETGEQTKTSHSRVKHAIEAVIADIQGDQGVTDFFEASRKTVIGQLSALKAALGSELLALSQRKFGKLRAEAEALKTRAAEATRMKATLDERSRQLRGRLRSAREPISGFAFLVTTLEKTLTAAEGMAATARTQSNAQQSLDEVTEQIRAAHDGPVLAQMVRHLDASASAERQEQAEWEAALAAFNREFYVPFTEALRANKSFLARFGALIRDDSKVREIQELRKMADEFATKGDHQMARYQLSLTRSRMEFFLKFPEGQDAAVLADLQKVPRQWRGVVQGYAQGVEATSQGIALALRAEDAASEAEAVSAAADSVKTILRSDAFDAIVAALDTDDAAAKKTAREAGLATVRDLRLLLGDPRVRALAKSPFSSAPGFTGHFEVGKFLLDVERTILLCTGS